MNHCDPPARIYLAAQLDRFAIRSVRKISQPNYFNFKNTIKKPTLMHSIQPTFVPLVPLPVGRQASGKKKSIRGNKRNLWTKQHPTILYALRFLAVNPKCHRENPAGLFPNRILLIYFFLFRMLISIK